ncbi:uncharacterized protein [Mobula birostris]|uniref:uncharacterized protein isoform X3 n=1 Tax=Mobula birostris TaxID=1983395 RepID=UPI003B27B85C
MKTFGQMASGVSSALLGLLILLTARWRLGYAMLVGAPWWTGVIRSVSGVTVILLVNCLVSLVMSVLTAIVNCRNLECCAVRPPVKMVVIHANQPAPPNLASIFSSIPAPTPASDGPQRRHVPRSTGQPEGFGPSGLIEKSRQDFGDGVGGGGDWWVTFPWSHSSPWVPPSSSSLVTSRPLLPSASGHS